jgi:hypothetical protein
MTESKENKLVHCFVCGAGSHRDDWQDGAEHACDSHSKIELAQARSKQGSAEKEQSKTAAARPAGAPAQQAKPQEQAKPTSN